jgi:hypothetical protein
LHQREKLEVFEASEKIDFRQDGLGGGVELHSMLEAKAIERTHMSEGD